ncbi:MAG: APC family permease [Gemmatimonadales bacterium]
MSGPRLERLVGVRALALMLVSVTVGAGIFGLPALAAHELGAAAVLAYLVCALVMALVGLCLAEAASRVPHTGGLYAIATSAFGPFAGAFVGMLLFTANGAFADAAVGALFADTVAQLFPFFAGTVPRIGLLLAVYFVATALNVRGVRGGVAAVQISTVIKLLPLVLLVAAGIFAVKVENLHWAAVPGIAAVGRTSVLLIFAFVGLEGALNVAGEVVNPSRTIPRGIFFGIGGVTILYLGLQFVAQGVLGPALATATGSPLADTAVAIVGGIGGKLVLVAIALATGAFIFADLLSQPRVMVALGEDGLLPAAMAKIDPVRRTPANAIIWYSILSLALAISGTFSVLALVSASGTLMIYLICSVGVIRLRQKGIRAEDAPFLLPGGPVIPVLAGVAIVALLASLTAGELLAIGGVAAACAIPYFIRRQRLSK